jgi:predicted nucleic acid-binding protein
VTALGSAVVDASVALKWVVEEDRSEVAARLLDGRPLHAPSLILVEAANALWVMQRRGTISADDGADALDRLASAPWSMPGDPGGLVGQAFRLARLLDHPVYDCVYLALAMEAGAPVVTADRRFLNAARADGDVGALVVPLEDVR